MIEVDIATPDALRYIVAHLREDDRIELRAMSLSDDNVDYWVDRIMARSMIAFVARYNGVPVSAWGMMPMWPGVGAAFAFGTDDWGRALLTMTKHVRRFMIPLLLEHGFHRIECRSLATRQEDMGRWLALLDAEPEAVLRGSGARGEDFILYRWLSDEHRHAPIKTTAPAHRQAGNGG